jgi:murein DD-endopeptidase MepM/ murein hydrolase activator NlpD
MFPLPMRARLPRSLTPARLALAAALLALALGALTPGAGLARPSLGQIRNGIAKTQRKLDARRGKARLLTTDVRAFSQRIDTVQGHITVLERRQAQIQADLDVKRRALLETQSSLRTAHARLARLKLQLVRGRRILARRLVQLYESDRPDLINVVLDARGFADLLESGQFLSRVGAQDRRVIAAVRTAKRETTGTVASLGTLADRERRIAIGILQRRNEVGTVRSALVQERTRFASARQDRARALAGVRTEASNLKGHLDFLQSEQSKIEAQIQAASSGVSSLPAGPIRGGGKFIWPVNGPITSPFCERRAWEACHPGIDIGVGSGTPIRAAGPGRVIIAGPEGGYGNYTCIQHAGPFSTCYGHQSVIEVHVGQTVSQGQVIGLSGCTGLCFGPHLHFEVRINGAVTNPVNYL